jgi:hypothetical protein
VVLLNTLGKFLELIVACRLSYMVEIYSLLSPTHLGGRRGISTDHAIQILLDRIHRAWGAGLPVVSMTLLDVMGVYDNTAHERLLLYYLGQSLRDLERRDNPIPGLPIYGPFSKAPEASGILVHGIPDPAAISTA